MDTKIDTSTIEGKIAVMQAFKEGKKIENRHRALSDTWTGCCAPSWNWHSYDYRIKREPEVLYRRVHKDGEPGVLWYTQEQKDRFERSQPAANKWTKFVEVVEN